VTEKPNYYIDPPLHAAIKDVLLVVSPNFSKDQLVFASSTAGLFKSTDAGRTWSGLTVSPSLADVPVSALGVSPDFADDRMIIVSLKGQGLYRSSDGGGTFVPIGRDLLEKNFDLKLIEFSPGFSVDGVIYGASDEVLLKSLDAGSSWSIVGRPVRYEDWRGEDRGPIRYEGNWVRQTGRQFSASTQAVADEPGATAALNFVGRKVTWFGERGPDAGQARVLVDGNVVSDVDLYSEQREPQSTLFSVSDLETGPHKILIEVLDRKNPLSAGHQVAVDGYDVMGL